MCLDHLARTVRAARIGVGPRLALTPSLAGTAPGGTVTLVASGGRPPYAFELLATAGSGSPRDLVLRAGNSFTVQALPARPAP